MIFYRPIGGAHYEQQRRSGEIHSVGGTPVGMDADAVAARAELARWLDRADFPATGPELVEAARDHQAPDAVVAELEKLPAGETYERVGDVVRALGYPTET